MGVLLVVLAGLEGVLRSAGVGAEARAVFVPVSGQEDYRVLNAAYVAQYVNRRFRPEVAYTPFLAEKAPGSFRVVVLGGSVAAGFPYRYYLGFPARLQHRLEGYAAGQRIEVVNLGFTAASSHVVRDLAEAVVALAPDAVMLHAGHDEFYGALGLGGALTPPGGAGWLKRAMLRLRRLALYQAVVEVFAEGPLQDGARTIYPFRVIRDTGIALDGAVYRAGLAQFEANMGAALQAFRQAGIPVFMGTLTANLKDRSPFGGVAEAQAAYERGGALLAQGDTVAARAAFLAAKEHDAIRLRAPEAVNAQIQRFAQEGLLTRVDLQPLAVAPSPHGIEDEWFFHDHIHPDHAGYDAIAQAFFDVLKTHPALRPGGLPEAARVYIRPDAFERGYADLQVSRMRAGQLPPEDEGLALSAALGIYRGSRHYLDSLTVQTFTDVLSAEEAVQIAVRRARSHADTLRALLLYRSLLHLRPFDAAVAEEAAAFAEAAADTTLLPLRIDVLGRALNMTGDARYRDRLAALAASP